ncbi:MULTISPECIES: VOC family protein [unclassified Nocardioides]|uniref:VOC family protein n=1 Tax=unclassified Nocardioides TaxID=2615069 RepID=UPI0006FC7547|nr:MULTISPECIES: VOC family protein [unclassified Nocardioides]KRA38215.1 glyoxalase [Nocardioides sp. Root614]KRA92175.1 glyoxalase [Nocardioides sp. Root682]
MDVTIDELVIADAPEAWVAAGFTVDDDAVCRVGSVRLRLVGSERGKGIVGWSLRGVPVALTDVDGVATEASGAPLAEPAIHANGVTHIDHVVLLSLDLSRTLAALSGIGLEPRRTRDGELGGAPVRQAFFRLGDVILEVVGSPDTASDGPSSLWGLTHTVDDIDATVAYLGERTGPVKDAVQPGRRITTVRNREIGISVRTALISPHVRSGPQEPVSR